MNKKVIWIVAIVIIIIGAGIGAYALLHKSAPTIEASVVIQTKTSSKTGQYLADQNGNPLYTYNSDTTGVSNCNGTCLLGWPVYTPSSSTGTLPNNVTIIKRSDNTSQYAYKGLPLYTFSGDVNGNVNGDGVSNFTVAKP